MGAAKAMTTRTFPITAAGMTWAITVDHEQVMIRLNKKTWPAQAQVATAGRHRFHVCEYEPWSWRDCPFGRSRGWIILDDGGQIVGASVRLYDALEGAVKGKPIRM